MKREFPASVALLKRSEAFPKEGPYGPITGFGYSNDELVELLGELSKRVAVGVHEIEHRGDETTLKISVYLTMARSEYEVS